MSHDFDKRYWESHWDERPDGEPTPGIDANRYVIGELADLPSGTALDAGCGEGGDALWLASRGWSVTGADISRTALERAAARAVRVTAASSIEWLQADLTTWRPPSAFDLVMTSYAHPTTPQLEFYERISNWVAPGGTLLVVAHLHEPGPDAHHGHPAAASVTAAAIIATLPADLWRIETEGQHTREVATEHGVRTLRDAVVRATRVI
jgi:2-polyprenyl-3-methyl-5-hydroxy-6-metoxy-1,4-benzoquinol methylase